ncbi:MAG: hypothetical protein FJX30_03425 [Alphaproteobacteria bacterium]|nr:hypothetical protein [Alphaproteobacteria bacterium]
MIKTVEVIVIIALLIFSFFLGVKYSDSIKSRMSWLETQDEQEVELPDLSNESNEIGNAPIDMVDPNSAPINDSADQNASIQVSPSDSSVNSQPQAVAPQVPTNNGAVGDSPVPPVQR